MWYDIGIWWADIYCWHHHCSGDFKVFIKGVEQKFLFQSFILNLLIGKTFICNSVILVPFLNLFFHMWLNIIYGNLFACRYTFEDARCDQEVCQYGRWINDCNLYSATQYDTKTGVAEMISYLEIIISKTCMGISRLQKHTRIRGWMMI